MLFKFIVLLLRLTLVFSNTKGNGILSSASSSTAPATTFGNKAGLPSSPSPTLNPTPVVTPPLTTNPSPVVSSRPETGSSPIPQPLPEQIRLMAAKLAPKYFTVYWPDIFHISYEILHMKYGFRSLSLASGNSTIRLRRHSLFCSLMSSANEASAPEPWSANAATRFLNSSRRGCFYREIAAGGRWR